MGLKLSELSQGRERIHEIKIKSLNDTLLIRELTRAQLEAFRKETDNFIDADMSQAGLIDFLTMTLTDEDKTVLTNEMAEKFIKQNANSIVSEVVKAVMDIHTGAEAGES